MFLEMVNDKFLTQHVESATHDSGNILYLNLSSEDDLVRDVEMYGKIGKNDHAMIKCKIHTGATRSRNTQPSRNFHRAKWEEMRGMMRKDWKLTMEGMNVNKMWYTLKESLIRAIALHVPMGKTKRTDVPNWLEAEMRKKIDKKRRVWKEWKRKGRATERAVYAKSERECKRMAQ